jgi:hypothetical protein
MGVVGLSIIALACMCSLNVAVFCLFLAVFTCFTRGNMAACQAQALPFACISELFQRVESLIEHRGPVSSYVWRLPGLNLSSRDRLS